MRRAVTKKQLLAELDLVLSCYRACGQLETEERAGSITDAQMAEAYFESKKVERVARRLRAEFARRLSAGLAERKR